MAGVVGTWYMDARRKRGLQLPESESSTTKSTHAGGGTWAPAAAKEPRGWASRSGRKIGVREERTVSLWRVLDRRVRHSVPRPRDGGGVDALLRLRWGGRREGGCRPPRLLLWGLLRGLLLLLVRRLHVLL